MPKLRYVVVERGLDSRPDLVKDEEGIERRRAGPPLSIMFHDYGLSTTIDKIDVDATGRRLPKEVREDLLRLKKLDSMSMVGLTEARNLQHAAYILQVYVDKLSLGRQVTETAMNIYRRALKKGLVKSRSIRSIVAGSLYAACRLMNVPRSLEEFERAYPMVRRKTVAQMYRLLVKNLGLKAPTQYPSIFVTKTASRLGLS